MLNACMCQWASGAIGAVLRVRGQRHMEGAAGRPAGRGGEALKVWKEEEQEQEEYEEEEEEEDSRRESKKKTKQKDKKWKRTRRKKKKKKKGKRERRNRKEAKKKEEEDKMREKVQWEAEEEEEVAKGSNGGESDEDERCSSTDEEPQQQQQQQHGPSRHRKRPRTLLMGDSDVFGACRSLHTFEKICRLGKGVYGTVYGALAPEDAQRAYALAATPRSASASPSSATPTTASAELAAMDTTTYRCVALKRVILHNEKKEGFPLTSLRELTTLRRLAAARHPYCVRLLDVAVGRTKESVFLVLEFCETDLQSLLAHPNSLSQFTMPVIKTVIQQLLSALDFLHTNWIIHRDVKPSNILYCARSRSIKLADFGMARTFVHPPQPLTRCVVTAYYRPLEVFFETPTYGTGVDVWSAACILAEMVRRGRLLFGPVETEADVVQRIFNVLGSPTEETWPGVSRLPAVAAGAFVLGEPRHRHNRLQELFSSFSCSSSLSSARPSQLVSAPRSERSPLIGLLQNMLKFNPTDRITAASARRHAFFRVAPLPCPASAMPHFDISGLVPGEMRRALAQQQLQPEDEDKEDER